MNSVWQKALDCFKEEVSTSNYRTWFSKTSATLENNKLLIETPSSFVKDQLTTKLRPLVEKVVTSLYGKVELEFSVNPSLGGQKEEVENSLELSLPISVNLPNNNLNTRYTLENFVVGLSNNLAFAAGQAVVQNPGISYNPLFIYGGTGVGKTHLMVGIGHALRKKNPNLRIIYCSSEKFTNDFVQSIQSKRTGDFRAKYRSCDLLLVDDIQFISGRDATQEEFFHTFNELQSKNSQIILTSDRSPHEIDKLEGRLQSRFQGGLMVDIQQPDFDTRVAILKAKCQEKGDIVSQECLTLIAGGMPTNGRELEGKLIQILQASKLNNQPLNLDFVKKFLGKTYQLTKIDHKKVVLGINHYFNIKSADLVGPRRQKELVIPRQFAMYLLYEECKLPFERIGELLGGRDHTTIMHGVDKIKEGIQRDREMQRILIEIKQTLAS